MFLRFFHSLLPTTAVLLLTLAVGSCKKEDTTTATQAQIDAQKKVDDDRIQAYIAAQHLTATRTASGLYYVTETAAPAGAPAAASGKLATVNYRGYLLNGTADGSQFDSSYRSGRAFSFTVGAGQVIDGWDEGVALMHKGEHGRLIIPSYMGYGPNATGSIPANSVLIFYIVVENVQ